MDSDATRGLSITDFNDDNAEEDFPVIDPPRPFEHPISPTTSERTSDEQFQSTKSINKHVRVEDVDDEEAVGTPPRDGRWAETFPTPAGTIKGRGLPSFERHRRTQEAEGDLPWAPFESKDDWELARWLVKSGVSQNKMNEFLKLGMVRIKR